MPQTGKLVMLASCGKAQKADPGVGRAVPGQRFSGWHLDLYVKHSEV